MARHPRGIHSSARVVPASPPPSPPASAPARRVLLVGWDGADWKIASPLIDAGDLPQLANLVAHGASGPLASLPPYLSPMLWNSIASGKYADQHGILGFTTTDPATGKLAAITSTQRKCKALWNILGEHGRTAHVLGWFASHPAENVTGVCVTEAFPRPVPKGAPWPLPPGSVHPPEIANEFGELRLRPEDVSHDLLRLFIPKIHEIDLTKDKRPGQLAVRLAELYTVHNAAIAALDRGSCDFLAVYYHFIDWVCHDFMDFHPPRRPNVPEREFEWYKDVVKSAYRLQDLLLRDLLKHAGADSTVVLCSDHGFHSDARRPVRIPMVSAGIALWHRAQGIFAAAGPGIARDQLIAGATVLDITPTILHLLGLPVGGDMDGRVIRDALAPHGPPVRAIPTYETVPGPHPRSRHLAALSHADQAALLEQFAALGYVDLATTGAESSVHRNDRDNRWNLAITLRHAGRNEPALVLLEELHLERPEDPRYAFHLAMCQAHLGLIEESAASCEVLLDHAPTSARARQLLAECATARGDSATALALLDSTAPEANSDEAPQPTVENSATLLQRGLARLKLGRLAEACADLHASAEADDENPGAWLGYAQALLAANHPAEAETCARQAVALAPTMAMAQFVLGRSLAAQPNRAAEARNAFTRARELNPRLIAADRALDQLAGKPFIADVAHVSETLDETPAPDRLRAASAARRGAHAQKLATLRATTGPVLRYIPPASPPAAGPPLPAPCSPLPAFVIVSGLPRSGTSLMMQMLARGGLPPMTDGQRPADDNNPAGYFEWEEIKQLPRDPSLITRTAGKAVKVVSPLLPHLPPGHRYKVIFMTRPAAEIARSQHRMRHAPDPAAPAADAMQPLLAQHATDTLAALRAAKHTELLEVDYPSLVADPVAGTRRVAEFLGAALLPHADAMPAAVRPELHRQKETKS